MPDQTVKGQEISMIILIVNIYSINNVKSNLMTHDSAAILVEEDTWQDVNLDTSLLNFSYLLGAVSNNLNNTKPNKLISKNLIGSAYM